MSEKCLIIGLGQIGMSYDINIDISKAVYTHARAFSLHHSFELCGGVDASATQREIFEAHYGLPAYTEIENAMSTEMPSIVVIALPTKLHGSAINSVLLHSTPKVILCEKPLAYDLFEAREMVEACENAGVKLYVNYMRISDVGVIEIKRRIDEGAIALPIKGVAWYSKGFLHNGSHLFNLLEYWLGSFVNAKVLDCGRLWDNQDPEPDVYVQFERGKVVFQAAWEEAFSHYTIELISPSGRLRYEQGGESIAWQSTYRDPNISGYQILRPAHEIINNAMTRYQWHVADQIVAALSDCPHNLCTGRQAFKTLEAIDIIINQRKS